jgi:CBS domain-containing protein
MPDSISRTTLREIEPLSVGDNVRDALRRMLDEALPALPAVDADGEFAGIFGEREFMKALFPGYVDTLKSAAMVRRSIDETIERRESCGADPVGKYLTTDHILVEDEFSDTQLAELFLHHRILIVPIATEGRVHAVITRREFFRELAERFVGGRRKDEG